MNIGVIKNTVCVNVIECESLAIAESLNIGQVAELPPTYGIGDIYENGQWSRKPEPEPEPEENAGSEADADSEAAAEDTGSEAAAEDTGGGAAAEDTGGGAAADSDAPAEDTGDVE